VKRIRTMSGMPQARFQRRISMNMTGWIMIVIATSTSIRLLNSHSRKYFEYIYVPSKRVPNPKTESIAKVNFDSLTTSMKK